MVIEPQNGMGATQSQTSVFDEPKSLAAVMPHASCFSRARRMQTNLLGDCRCDNADGRARVKDYAERSRIIYAALHVDQVIGDHDGNRDWKFIG